MQFCQAQRSYILHQRTPAGNNVVSRMLHVNNLALDQPFLNTPTTQHPMPQSLWYVDAFAGKSGRDGQLTGW